MTATARVIGAAFGAALLAGAAAANVFPDASGRDPRVLEPRSNWSPVALLYSNVDRQTGERRKGPTGAPGTGFMISPCYLLINYHVALGEVAARGASLT